MDMSSNENDDIHEHCGSLNNLTSLSIFSAVSSGSITITSVPLNLIIIICIIREKNTKFKSLFYKLLLNIAFADFFAGLIAAPISICLHVKETLGTKLYFHDAALLHLSVFITDAVALMTTTLLCTDRIIALLLPIRHRKGINRRTENIIVYLTWPLSVLLIIPYFKLYFIKQLAIFSAVNISITIFSMILTTIMYKTRKIPRSNTSLLSPHPTNGSHAGTRNASPVTSPKVSPHSVTSPKLSPHSLLRLVVVKRQSQYGIYEQKRVLPDLIQKPYDLRDQKYDSTDKMDEKTNQAHDTQVPHDEEIDEVVDRNGSDSLLRKCSLKEKVRTSTTTSLLSLIRSHVTTRTESFTDTLIPRSKATRTFLLLSLIFLVTYLPTYFMMIYMNVCVSCNCRVIHIMRDLSITSILSSSLFRPASFIIMLKHLQASVKRILSRKPEK